MAGYRPDFGGNVDYAYQRGVTDLTRHFERGMNSAQGGAGAISQWAQGTQQASRGIQDMSKQLANLQQQLAVAMNPAMAARLKGQIDATNTSIRRMGKEFASLQLNTIEKGFKRLTMGLIELNSGILGLGFDFIISSIKRVYELQERWTKAIGGFNLRIGGMTAGLRGAQRAASQWSGTIRGLTGGDIEEGIQMFADFTDAIGRTVEAGDDFEKFGLQLARGFNLGGQGAGQLTRVFQNIGDSVGDAAGTMKSLVAGANEAHVPTNLLAKDVLESSKYMARFGKEAQKTFVTGAAYVRKYNISMEQLRGSVEGLDMFDEAAKTAAKLNTAFGTMINGMDLMMEDDPAKRLEMIRQQFLAQGQTYDRLTPKQRRYLSETLKLTEDQTAALLDSSHANESYEEFQAKAASREKDELDAKKLMEMQLRKTAQTMYAFGAAFDKVTVAIANAIKPLLKVLGLAGQGDKEFTSFGQVMESITDTVVEFFNSLAKNAKWQGFMEDLAHDLQDAGKALRDFVMDGRAADLVGEIVDGMKSFYDTVKGVAKDLVPLLHPLLSAFEFLSKHIGLAAAGWAGMKGINMLSSLGVGAGGMGRLGMAGAAGAAGYALGGTGAGVGAGIGSLVGGFMGPIGMIAGPVIGGIAGKLAEWIFNGSGVKSDLEEAHARLDKQIEEETKKREAFSALTDAADRRQSAEDHMRKSRNQILKKMEETALQQKGQSIELNSDEVEMLKSRADELTLFGKSANANRKLLDNMGEGTKLTAAQLKGLNDSAGAYDTALDDLRTSTKKLTDLQMDQLEISNVGQRKQAGEALKTLREAELKSMNAQLEEGGGRFQGAQAKSLRNEAFGYEALTRMSGATKEQVLTALEKEVIPRLSSGIDELDPKTKAMRQQLLDNAKKDRDQIILEQKIDKLDLENTKGQKDLLQTQTEFLRQQTILQLRSTAMGSTDFLKFMATDAEKGKGEASAFQDYLQSTEGQQAMITGFGQAGYDLINEGPSFANINKATAAPPSTGPSVSGVGGGGFSMYGTGGGGGGFSVVSSVAEVNIDGQRAGNALVKTMIQQ